MKSILLSSFLLLLAGFTVFGQQKNDKVIIKTIITDDDSGEKSKTIEIITSEDNDIQDLIDSILQAHGDADVNVNIIKVPGFGGSAPFNWFEFEGMEDLEDLEDFMEMGEHMKWMGVDDIEHLRKMQWEDDEKPFLGVIIDTDVKMEKGLWIMNIVEESAAADAGLKKEDILITIDDSPINSLEELVESLSGFEIGDEIEITYIRDDVDENTTAVLKSRADSKYDLAKSFQIKTPACCASGIECQHHSNKNYKAFVHKQKPKLGVYVEDLDEEMIKDLKVTTSKGVLVTKVLGETAAEKMGLKVNDVLLSLNNEEISDVNILHELLGRQKLGDEIEIAYLRYGVKKSAKGVLFEFNHHSAIDNMIFYNDENK